MVSFIHNGSEITTWMGYSFKTKSTKFKTKQGMELYDNFVDRFQDLSKVQNPPVSKAKV